MYAGERGGQSARLNSINPATGAVISTYADGSADEVNRAIAIAREAFLETVWRGDRRPRARAINEMADHFEARTEELIGMGIADFDRIVTHADGAVGGR
jgi:betaine-aldehyde dehydrogenase